MVQSTASDMPAIVFSGSHLESYGRKFSPISTNGAIVKLRSTGVFNITIVWKVPTMEILANTRFKTYFIYCC